ncbi:hypothetical protein FACS1894110_08270 [Spirochaetia bacterium]|nr:hypothetical protein FACS1894110_08270 [Spirochaetia bacterium]
MKKFFIVLIAIALMGSFFIGCNDQVQDMQYNERYEGAPRGSFTGPTALDPALYESEIRLMYQPTPATLGAAGIGTSYEFSRSLSKDGKTGSLLVTESKDTLSISEWTKMAGSETTGKKFPEGIKEWNDVLIEIDKDIGDSDNYPVISGAAIQVVRSITITPVSAGAILGKPPLTYTFTTKHTLKVDKLYKYTGAFE